MPLQSLELEKPVLKASGLGRREEQGLGLRRPQHAPALPIFSSLWVKQGPPPCLGFLIRDVVRATGDNGVW